jgi:transposase-like protein
MAKQAIYMDEARRRYVEEGLSLDAIVGLLANKVSRKTLYNWKQQYEWDDKRKAFLDQHQDLKLQLIQLAQQVFNEAKANPTQKNLKRMLVMFAAVDKYGDTSLFSKDLSPDQQQAMKKALPPETLDYIKSLYGLK